MALDVREFGPGRAQVSPGFQWKDIHRSGPERIGAQKGGGGAIDTGQSVKRGIFFDRVRNTNQNVVMQVVPHFRHVGDGRNPKPLKRV